MFVEIIGSSHGAEGITTTINGLPPGLHIDIDRINHDLHRRRPGQALTTPREEKDQIDSIVGLQGNLTTDEPLVIHVPNETQRSADYSHLSGVLRPGHGVTQDLLADANADTRGGGSSSARLTIGNVIAGSVAAQILEREMSPDFEVVAGLSRIASVAMAVDSPEAFTRERVDASLVKCPDAAVSKLFEAAVRAAQADGDSLGAEVTIIGRGIPQGIGQRPNRPFDGLVAGHVMSINAVKSVEIGALDIHTKRGSEVVDHIAGISQGQLVTERNLAGGILGGRTTGEELIVRAGFKPTSTQSAVPMRTVGLDGSPRVIDMKVNKGRHDPCVAIRGCVVAEATVAIAILEGFLAMRQK
ncbi:MAG: chorismate synthase [Candidatus Saccharimonas sp.]